MLDKCRKSVSMQRVRMSVGPQRQPASSRYHLPGTLKQWLPTCWLMNQKRKLWTGAWFWDSIGSECDSTGSSCRARRTACLSATRTSGTCTLCTTGICDSRCSCWCLGAGSDKGPRNFGSRATRSSWATSTATGATTHAWLSCGLRCAGRSLFLSVFNFTSEWYTYFNFLN